MIKYILKQPDGSTFNPMTMDEIRMMAEEGSLSSAHSLQIQGGTEWHPISKIQGLLPESRMPKASQSTVQSIASSQFKNIKADELYKKSVVKLSSASSLLKNKKATIIIGAAFILVLIFLFSSY